MLDLLRETLHYIEQQHDWLAYYIQSVIAEKEQKYKLLHTKITCKISEELNNYESADIHFDDVVVVKQESWDSDAELEYDNSQDIIDRFNETFEPDVVKDGSCPQTIVYNAHSTIQLNHKPCSSKSDDISLQPVSDNKNSFVLHNNNNVHKELNSRSNIEKDETKQNVMNQSDDPSISKNIPSKVFEHSFIRIPLINTNFDKETVQSLTNHYSSFRKPSSSKIISKKTFKCPYCPKEFARSDGLVIHKHIHTDEKPFTCSLCDKSFTTRSILSNHIRIHTGEKPYKCQYCNKSFARRYTLTNHIDLMHNNK